MPGVLLIGNAAAGSLDPEPLAAVAAVLRPLGDVQTVTTASSDELGAVLAGLDGRTLVVAGGDGSIHAAVQVLHDRGAATTTAVGLVPLGTGNDLARGLGIPLDPVAAAQAVVAGGPRRLDLLITDRGQVVVNVSHAGLGAAAAGHAEAWKDRIGPLAYPVGALISGVAEAGTTLAVTLDEVEVHRGPTLMVGVANAPSIGGGTQLVPNALPDDGLLDVLVVTAVSAATRVGFADALRHGRHLDRDDVLHLRGRCVVIAGDPVAHDLDGEVLADQTSVTYTVVPGGWTVIG